MSVTFLTRRMTSRDTKEAIYIWHPNVPLKMMFLPRAAVIHMSETKEKGVWAIEIPDSLAEEKGIQ